VGKANNLMTKALEKKLVKNHLKALETGGGSMDTIPLVKIFTPDAGATWHFSEYDPENRMFFGLCDLGMGMPEMGYASRDELEAIRGKFGLPVEREMYGSPTKTFNELIAEAKGY
jgi:hypothetical protein